MPSMPLEVKIATIAFIVLLVGLIAVYHVWLDRRTAARERTLPPGPDSFGSVPDLAAPPAATVPRESAAPDRPPAAGTATPANSAPGRPPSTGAGQPRDTTGGGAR